jgi:hypothetical protein
LNRNTLRLGGTALVATLGFVFAQSAFATIYYVSGTIEFLVSIDSSFGPNDDWVSLSGVAPQGTCATAGIGSNMGIAIKDDGNGQRQFAELLAAKTNGTLVNIRVDDTVKNGNGYCYLEFLW